MERVDVLGDPRWDRLVERHPLAWVSHTSAWARVLVESFPQLTPCYLGLAGDTGELEAGLPLCLVRTPFGGKRLVGLPFSTLCWPLSDSLETTRRLLEEAVRIAGSEAAALEIRSESELAPRPAEDPETSSAHCCHELDLAEITDLPPRNVRRPIRKADSAGLSCRFADSEADLATFYRLYVLNRKRNWLPPLPYPFFVNQWRGLQPAGLIHLLLAETRQGELAAGLITYSFGDRMSGETMAWDWQQSDVYPSHFIWWEGIRLARRFGHRVFDFGRTARDDAGLMEFKRRWGTREVDLPVYSNPPADRRSGRHQSLAYRGVQLVSRLTPLPLLPKLGEVCFRYWS